MYDSALADLRAAMDLSPNAETYSNRGHIHSENDEFEHALADFNKALELDPNLAIAYNNRGGVYEKTGKLDLALADFNKALELDPKLAHAYNNRGNVHAKNGEIDLAIEEYTQALKIESGNSTFLNNRGVAYANNGDYDLALADYNKALKTDPSDETAIRNRDSAIAAKVREETSEQYQEQLEKQREQFAAEINEHRTEFLERREYKKRQDDYQKEADKTEKRIKWQFACLHTGVLAAFAFSLFVAHMLLFQPDSKIWPGILPIFPLITVLGLCLSPLIWRIRTLKQEKARLLALSHDAYTKGILANLINVDSDRDPEFRKELLHKFFDHHAQHGSAQLIVDLEKDGKSDSNPVNILTQQLKDNPPDKD